MYNKLRKLMGSQVGESPLTLPITMLIIAMVLYMGVDFLGIYATSQKLRTAASETITLMKIENGWDSGTQTFFHDMLDKLGLPPNQVKVNFATPKNQSPPVQRGDPVSLDISTTYEVRSLKPLNHAFVVPVRIKLTGLAQEYVR
ncbi:DUF4320 family protein [Phosphitispora sp. TUW77]|uniref:DUF4320 family protein n=1 Tax=Phosphitispora sp. TUW77 TaxID=3152361 RepID=UPI003AB68292